ncbi:hypothetical protein Francci3_2442 [Frankia casuarinae]|uniref:Uncharacterized protein n=1 Tax=Frankia casuarinae (strain DSM 45818 / CECT 9043 / HFP020203 / CcI3) TaxID=106370 RepID=Q2JA83_FRACC|nr:hypothetical protein Francci3_2442 [Frankia casuarinae]
MLRPQLRELDSQTAVLHQHIRQRLTTSNAANTRLDNRHAPQQTIPTSEPSPTETIRPHPAPAATANVDQLNGTSDYVRSTVATILGQTVHIVGASDSRSEGRIRGLTAKTVLYDEITLSPEPMFQQTLARLSLPYSRLIGSTNPDSPAHWLRKKIPATCR